tara:strand:+ start:755 stop:1372 length:618 start_codon:yes stop_codon:yes gene_type:complete
MIVGIIDLKLSNIFSIKNACIKLGYDTRIIENSKDLETCDSLILPGVGAFHKAMYRLNKSKLSSSIKKFIENNKPFLGICLGMQLLFSKSHEFVTTDGIGIFKGEVINFQLIDKSLKVPHIGMNYLELTSNFKNSEISLFEKKKYFFNHSFCVQGINNSLSVANTKYNKTNFCSVVKKNKILGTQFHPELSYDHGLKLIKCLENL